MNQKNRKALSSFRKISWVTTVAVYFLILVGGIVRSTGAGMGCPDWPKCFESWVPPTSVEQLPSDYEVIYLEKRIKKNERFVGLLENLGFPALAEDIRNDKSILENEPFNATKTWIEYINRLIGALIGLLIIITFLYSLRVRKIDYKLPLLAFAALVLVIFQGWLGSIVVSTNLLQWMISLHMLVALLLVCLLLYIYFRAGYLEKPPINVREGTRKSLQWIMGLGILLMLVQIVLGTQVRENIDILARRFDYLNRDLWIPSLGLTFLIHRSYSLLLLGLHLYFGYLIWKNKLLGDRINKLTYTLIALIIVVIISGAIMAYFAIPAILQPLHLLLGSLIIGFQFYIWLELGKFRASLKFNTL